jgi:hypothetical protein
VSADPRLRNSLSRPSDQRPGELDDEYLTLTGLRNYSKVSLRQLTRFLSRPVDPLPHVRNGRRPLVLRSAFDRWIDAETCRQRSPAPLARGRSFREITQEVKARRA